MIEANRRNAARCTGPRTAASKARSRLNALRHGRRSVLLRRYFCLWRDVQLTTPLEPPPPWNGSRMPVPLLPSTGPGKFRGRIIRELLQEVAVYLAPRPIAPLGRHVQTILFDTRNRQVIERKGGVFAQTEKQTEKQPETKRPPLEFGLAMGENRWSKGKACLLQSSSPLQIYKSWLESDTLSRLMKKRSCHADPSADGEASAVSC